MLWKLKSGLTKRGFALEGEEVFAVGETGDPYFDSLSIDHLGFLINSYRTTIKPGAVVFDVGANLGLTSVVFSKLNASASVYSFEPSRNIYRCLKKTIRENNLVNCFPMQKALSANVGSISFSDNRDSASASHLSLNGESLGHVSYPVEVSTIDAVYSEKGLDRLDFIKIDVEGFEGDVLQGGLKTLQNLKPTVFLEFNSFTLIAYRNINPRVLLDKLRWIFPYIYCFNGSELILLDSDDEILGFIHRNLVYNGCVDDLLCSFAPISF